jgi:hypothetical protein
MKQFTALTRFTRCFVGISALLLSFNGMAQTMDLPNNPPTAEELKEKMDIMDGLHWETPLGKMDSLGKMMITGPEQDCSGAIAVCSQTYTQSTSYTGVGTVDEVNKSTSCLKSGEKNSVWYVFTTQSAGNFGFTLNTVKDYDYALYDITTIGCAGIPTTVPDVCNYSSTKGSTGMSASGTGTSQAASGVPFCALLATAANHTYVLIISNYTGDATGYTLTFTTGAGYTSITDAVAPTINPPSTVTNNCNNTITVTLSEPVRCSSIASNGSDFTLSNGGAITAASGVGCSGSSDLTSQILITYTAPTSRTYTLGVQTGTDGNTILDKCGNAMLTSQTLTFNHLTSLTLSANTPSVCNSGTAVTLTATGANTGGTYTLNPGGASNTTGSFSVSPTITTAYTVSVTYGGCTKTASTTVSVLSNVVASIDPVNPTICSGTTTLTASAVVNGASCPTCTFSWAPGGATTASITVGSGTYTVTVTKPGSTCTGSATSTVSVTSGSSSNCNVIYVSPTGTGTGTSPSDPTSIDDALSQAVCMGAVIKCQGGTYNTSDKLTITSYTILEGGYNATFTTKSSDMTSGTATTIVRDATPDGGSGLNITGIEVSASQTGFRIQDIRIEMPINAEGAQLTNYGIKLGASCTSYNIVRCYIDAGAGSD